MKGENIMKKYYVISIVKGDEFTEGKFEDLNEAIKCARDAWDRLTRYDKQYQEIEIRQYEEDIEDENCENFDYNTFEWEEE